VKQRNKNFFSWWQKIFNAPAKIIIPLIIWAVLVRLPFSQMVGEDEAFFALVAQRWLEGNAPYATSFDVKPPGLFAIFSLAIYSLGFSIFSLKVIELIAVATAVLGLLATGRRLGNPLTATVAAALYPVISLTMSGTTAPTDILRSPLLIFTVLLALQSRESVSAQQIKVMGCGLLIGIAITIKQTAVFFAIAFFAWMYLTTRGNTLRSMVSYGIGLAVVPLAFLGYFWINGETNYFLESVILSAAGRMKGDGVSFTEGLFRFLPMATPLLPMTIVAIFAITRWRCLQNSPQRTAVALVLFWVASECVGILAVRSMYDHYFLPLISPLLLLALVIEKDVIPTKPSIAIRRTLAVGTATLVWSLNWIDWPWATEHIRSAQKEVATEIRRLELPKNASILMINRGLPVYLYAERMPAGRIFHPQHLLCDFPNLDEGALISAMNERPSLIVVADRTYKMVCELPDRWRLVDARLKRDYCLLPEATSKSNGYAVWGRRDEYGRQCTRAG
jgi:4-amino-4-deoxy-L-arabinose transferase-like glycosyltransferase